MADEPWQMSRSPNALSKNPESRGDRLQSKFGPCSLPQRTRECEASSQSEAREVAYELARNES